MPQIRQSALNSPLYAAQTPCSPDVDKVIHTNASAAAATMRRRMRHSVRLTVTRRLLSILSVLQLMAGATSVRRVWDVRYGVVHFLLSHNYLFEIINHL